MKLNGGPAFPSHGTMGEVVQDGMTLRDYFAAAALTGLLSQSVNRDWEPGLPGRAAERAYTLADAMIAERNRQL